ncbi:MULTISPECIES: glutamine amidotransferase [Agrobacterium]|uniref:glutamine amidotransferase n=1 Tax=Agrobacterium TaxID=357 RepID=UPI001574A4E5|nr:MULTISPECIES: glutamine amidotransferase [Agrobacterium]MBO9111222.1 cytoplasmic protein [Agrobacterium sp. S2/73]MDP9757735.1 putative membrane protein [Agrobacterium tumefaciens]MDQ1218975.1 putative membrane protein [Agrobacterium sp. SORGH_AS_0745]NTA18345.1 cytoplasmic protein [Agrobacterium tumefaciens]QXZ75162.1 cytoplasmic protein [Agrobacterium sp. S7/73]
MTKKILLVGESWVSSATHYKGFDQFGSVTFHLGAEPLVKALESSEYELTYLTAHDAVEKLPFDMAGLDAYDAIILSDIGANSLLLPPAVWLHSKTVPNRLKLLKAWVEKGGGLLMVGGYFSFQGIDGKARWRRTPVEDTLPVTCLPWDDRVEIPEGSTADILMPDHPTVAGLSGEWPLLLGVNEVEVRERADVDVVARLPAEQGGHPLLVTGVFGQGRTAAWTSDIGPHWLSPAFCEWQGYGRLWKNILGWLTEAR